MSESRVREIAHRLWIVRSSAGMIVPAERDWEDAEKLINTKTPEEIEQYLKDLPIALASEPEEDDFEATKPECHLANFIQTKE
jgi:hypothetical protein